MTHKVAVDPDLSELVTAGTITAVQAVTSQLYRDVGDLRVRLKDAHESRQALIERVERLECEHKKKEPGGGPWFDISSR